MLQRLKDIKSGFVYSDGKVQGATVEILEVDIKLSSKTGASSGLCRAIFQGRYPLKTSSRGDDGSSDKRKQWKIDLEAGEVLVANKFAQLVVRTLDQSRIGPVYKVPNEKVRVLLDGTGRKMDEMYKRVLDGKPPIVVETPAAVPTSAAAAATSSQTPSTLPQATPKPASTPLPGSATPMVNGSVSQLQPSSQSHSVPPRPPTTPKSFIPPPPPRATERGSSSFYSSSHGTQTSHPSAYHKPASTHAHPASLSRHDPSIPVPRKPFFRTDGRSAWFNPLNPYYNANVLLRERYNAQMREYEALIAKAAKQSSRTAATSTGTAGDDFINAPFKPERKRVPTGPSAQPRPGKEASSHDHTTGKETPVPLSSAVSEDESSSDSEAEDDVIIDRKRRLERHRGEVRKPDAREPTTPVKSGQHVMPSTVAASTPRAKDQDNVDAVLEKNGHPYIFVPRIASLQVQNPLGEMKRYFRGCLEVRALLPVIVDMFDHVLLTRIQLI